MAEVTVREGSTCAKCGAPVGEGDQYCHGCWAELPTGLDAKPEREWQALAYTLTVWLWVAVGFYLLWTTSQMQKIPDKDFMVNRSARGNFVGGVLHIAVGLMLWFKVGVAFNIARVVLFLWTVGWGITLFAGLRTPGWWIAVIAMPIFIVSSWRLIKWADPDA